MVVAAVVRRQAPLAVDRAAELAAPDDERLVEQTAGGEILDEGRLWHGPRHGTELSRYVRTTLLRKDVVVNIRIPGLSGNTQDSGENFESIPKAGGGPGYFFHGLSMTKPHVDFFKPQRVNTLRPVNTNWLLVGHVDEVVSLAPLGDRVMVADPDSAWALLLWANKLDPTVRMLEDMNDDPEGEGVAVADVLGDAALRAWNFSTVMAAGNLPAIRESVDRTLSIAAPT